jgi:hypothetical protein
MVEELLIDKKLIPVPKHLADQLRQVTIRVGTNISRFTADALEQALRAEQLGSDLKETVDLYQMNQIQRGAGMVFFQRAGFKELLTKLFKKDRETLLELWYNSGRWYSAYLTARLSQDILGFLEKDLLVSWNLDESEILTKDVMVSIRLTSFRMSSEFTELLVMYTKGIFEELGYDASDEDVLPGLISIKFLKKMKKN